MGDVPTVEPAAPESEAPRLKIGFNENGAALLAMAVLLLGAVLWVDSTPVPEGMDFSLTYVAGWIIHHGRGAQLYDLAEEARVRDALFQQPKALIFEHPPFEALIFSPLAALPYRTAYLIWGLVNALVWLTIPFLLRPYAPAPREPLGYLALWLLFAPLGVALVEGQPSIVLLLVFTLTFIQLKRGDDLKAGLCLGLGLFRFHFVLPFALIFLLRKKWRFLAGFSLSAALLGVVSLAAVGWQGVVGYVQLLAKIAAHPENISYGWAAYMPTLQGFIYALLGSRLSRGAVSLVVAAASLGLLLYTAWRWRQADRGEAGASFDLLFAAAIAVSLMTGFHMFAQDFSPLLLSLFMLAAHFPARGHTAWRVLLALTMFFFWFPPAFFGLYFSLLGRNLVYLLLPFPAVVAFGALRQARERQW